MTGEPLVRFEAVAAGYRGPVVGPASFAVHSGEVIGLTGANGSGKSTLLGVLTGRAQVFGGEIRRRPDLRVAFQRQQPLGVRGLPLRAGELLAAAGAEASTPPALRALLDKRADSLSGGQLQLLQVWAALGAEANLVVLDEPTNNMDPQGVRTLAEMLKIPPQDRGVLLVTHDHALLSEVCSRTVEVTRWA
jgi:zinc transport system ATP-binding protein